VVGVLVVVVVKNKNQKVRPNAVVAIMLVRDVVKDNIKTLFSHV
jgi:hypothetical protein